MIFTKSKSVEEMIAEGEQLIADGRRVQEIVDLRLYIRKKRLQLQREKRLQNQGE